MQLHVGIKTDPILYRYSYDWLFRILEEEGIHHVQLGTFFELYQLPDDFFRRLRATAAERGVAIHSVFTSHRELGGFFRREPGFVEIARRNFARQIEIAGLLGAKSAGSNPGAVLRDEAGFKAAGTACYLQHMKELMEHAKRCGLDWVSIEPMSCLAEPPTLPEEIRAMAEELDAHYRQASERRARAGFCSDISHGYADQNSKVVYDNVELLMAALPWTFELHLRNTDKLFNSTFGFTAKERARGIVDVTKFRDLLLANAGQLPVREMVGYFEVGGPKLGRDYSDHLLEAELRESLQFLRANFATTGQEKPAIPAPIEIRPRETKPVLVAPSMMCADQCELERSLRRLETNGADWLHFDVMDAHFVPNMPLGLETIRALRPKTGLPFDVHLMVENNDFFIRELAKIGVQSISIHAESATHLDRSLHLIRDSGIKAGVALNPATPLMALDYVLESLDFVLLMTVNPGFAGQKLVKSAFRKITDCRAKLDRRILIEVDGNVSFENIPKMVAAGADVLVAGTSSVFHSAATLAENFQKTGAAIAAGLQERK